MNQIKSLQIHINLRVLYFHDNSKVYNQENIDQIDENDLQFQISDSLFFSTLLMELRATSISYSIKKKKEIHKHEKILIDKKHLQ